MTLDLIQKIIQNDLTLIKHKNKTLTTDANGKVVGTYSKPEGQIPRAGSSTSNDTTYVNEYVRTHVNGYNDFSDDKSVLTGQHGNLFLKLFRAIIGRVNRIWTSLTDGSADININDIKINGDLQVPFDNRIVSVNGEGYLEGVYRKPENSFTRSLSSASSLSDEEYLSLIHL